jgi:peptide/nickel transport system substrate-binding protein
MDTKTISAIVVVLIIVVALGAYVAMKGGGGAETTTAKAEKVITIGVTDKVTDLDPSNAYDFFTWEVLYNTMEGLVKYKTGTLDIVPGLAENWTVSDDGLTWTFKLRQGLKFADGTPLTAKDVIRSINRVMTIKGDPSWLVTSFVKSVEAPDDLTVVFHLKKPISYFLYLLVTPPYFPVNPQYPDNEIVSNATWGGAGPYMIKSFVRDQELVLVPNPYYYGEKPKNDKIIIRFYKDASTMRLALQKGEIDIAWRTLQPTDIKFFSNQTGFKVVEVPGAFIRYIVLNVKMDPTSNKLVRKALAASINRTDIIDSALFGAGEPLYSMIPTSMSAYKPVFKTVYGDANFDLAKQLLTQAGYSESNPLQITLWYTPTHYGDTESSIATVLKQEWESTGMIKVTVRSAEWGEYVDKARHGELMVYLLGWYPDYLDPDDYTTPFLHTGDNSWLGNGYSNPEMDKLLEQAQVVLDQTQRNQLYSQVQDILAEDVPLIPMFEGKLYIVAHDNVKGIIPSHTMIFFYSTLEK